MKLTSIEAIRYGAMQNGCLNGLGDGLTVVLGPNESGKSTFTALTRHVLYGFPDARTRERGYSPMDGPRAARLVFADETGEWAIERVDGPRRGPVTVTARRGDQREGLLNDIVGGVSEQTFRVMFGFGLDELAEIESGDNADVVSRLYAAGAGLVVNPIDVRRDLEKRASDLYAPRGQKPTVNMLAARARELKGTLRELEAEAAGYADAQSRLAELEARLATLKKRRDELDALSRGIERDSQRLGDAADQVTELEEVLRKADSDAAELSRSIELVDVDEAALASRAELDAVLEELSGFRQRLEAVVAAQAAADQVDRTLAEMPDLPDGALDSPESRSAVERWRDRLADARRESDTAARTAEQAATRARETERVAGEATAVEKPRRPLAAGLALVAVGLVAIVAGVFTSQWLAAGLGAAAIVAGVVVLLRPPSAGAGASSLPDDVARLKAEAQASAVLAQSAATALSEAEAEWSAWLAERSLDAYGEDPVAVRELLEALRERAALRAQRQRHLDDAARERAAAEAWVVRLVDVVRAFDPSAAQMPQLQAAPELAARARSVVDRAVAADEERRELSARLEVIRSQRKDAAERLATLTDQTTQIAAARGIEPSQALAALDRLAASTGQDLEEAREHCDALATEAAELRGSLDTEGRDSAMAVARQELEGVSASASAAADEYLVTTLAVNLLDRARDRFERERQPELVRTAARVFSAMTGGRYTDVRAPLDGSGITVLAGDGSMRSTEQLSRGTAEQLYLALRVGLMGSLGEQGRSLPLLMDDVIVNFDPERRAGSVEAVSELARMRQVLFFTCHPETAELLAGKVEGSVLVTLDRCEMRG